jgi:antitoxin component YwqK of YwqJK toxin-antitoxin module
MAGCSYSVRFKDGKIVGRWKWFYKSGEPRGTGGFDDKEQKHGEWTRYHANGQLWDEGRFEQEWQIDIFKQMQRNLNLMTNFGSYCPIYLDTSTITYDLPLII